MENNKALPRPMNSADFAETSAKYPILILAHDVIDGDRVLKIVFRRGHCSQVFASITSQDVINGAWTETLLWTTTDFFPAYNPNVLFSRVYGRYLGIRKTSPNSLNEQRFLAALFNAAYECGRSF